MTEEFKNRGMFQSDRCQFCHEFGEKIEPYLCLDCKAKIQKLGYVQLDEDQSLSRNPNLGIPPLYIEYKEAQQDMLKAGWRKVKAK